jgi:hypothetical protein
MDAILAVKDEAMERFAIELGAHARADLATYREGVKIIELFVKLPKFMEFGADLHAKARMAKMVLSDLSGLSRIGRGANRCNA